MSTALAMPVRAEPERAEDAEAIEAVVASAFGPGRWAKTAERLREGGRPLTGFVMRDEAGQVAGTVRLWPIAIGTTEGGTTEAAFLGPIAVLDRDRREGRGATLVQQALVWAADRGLAGVLLVGDLGYFGRFGFVVADDVTLPGPVAAHRVLWFDPRGRPPPTGPVRRR